MSELLFVDTSAWFAYVNRSDPAHQVVREILLFSEGRLITSNFIRDETITLCLRRAGHRIARQVGEVLFNPRAVRLLHLSPEDERQAWNLFVARPDKVYSFTDCTSFVLMRNHGLERAVSLDEDFRREGFAILPH